MKAWLAAFDAFDALGARMVVPAHGAAASGELIAANRTWVRQIRDKTLAMKAQGRTVDEAAAAIQAEFVAQHPAWPRANGLAALARSAYTEGQ